MSVRETFMQAAAQRILINDGGFGTEIQAHKLDEADFAGTLGLSHDQKGNNDILALTAPHVPEGIHRAYFEAGADIASVNTFSANRISQADYGAEHLVREINVESARIARRVADEFTAKDGLRFVAGSVGPTNKTLSLSPDVADPGFREVDWDLMVDVYREQAAALVEGGSDFILVETVFDTLNCKAAIMAVKRLERELGREVPLMLSLTLTDLSGRNLSGHTVEAFWYAVRHAKPLTVGLNCSFGAAQLRPHVRTLSAIADTLVMVYPNAGLPNELGEYDELPAETAGMLKEWADGGLVNVLGGAADRRLRTSLQLRAVDGATPRKLPTITPEMRLAGLEPFYDSRMTDPIIREATATDAERLSLIASATFIDTFAGVLDGDAVVAHCTNEHAPEKFAAMLAKGARAWIAELGGAPIGYALLKQPELEAAREGDVELKKIYVLSRFHGTGIAGALFEAALKSSEGFERLLLGVKDDNDRAIAFYSKMGFEKIGTRRFPVGDQLYDDLVMALVLPRKDKAAR